MKLRNMQRLLAGIGSSLALVTVFSGTSHANTSAPNVGYGYPNSYRAVRCAQVFANRYGHYTKPIAEDGAFGPMTKQAIMKFQDAANRYWGISLTVDGVVGKDTGQAMLNLAHNDPTLEPGLWGNCSEYLPSRY
ncbi:peptidoglycan-binding domain-containing protein [Streptomyces goshikiensis]|uniref:peptidoglycan-binding domain-containing protein n=1 Tax=Streptomyces goshikiensis TaxID=1942 RepID=UPI0033230A85